MSRTAHELRLDAHVAQWTVQALTRLVATFAIVQGVFIIIGGPGRWQAPSFAAAMEVPGAPESWGTAVLAVGALALYGTFTPRMTLTACSIAGIGAWCLFFAISLCIVTLRDDRAATTGVITYTAFAVLSCALGVPYLQSRRR